MSDRTYDVYSDDSGVLHIRTDAPGERAVSAPFDPVELISLIAKKAGLMVEIIEQVAGSGSGS